MILKDIHILILIGVIVVTAGGTVLGALRFAIPDLRKNLTALVERVDKIEAHAHDPRFVTTDYCDRLESRYQDYCQRSRSGCQLQIASRIDELRADLQKMDSKRERAKADMIPRAEFENLQKEMHEKFNLIFSKMDRGAVVIARLDERVNRLIKNGQSNMADLKDMNT